MKPALIAIVHFLLLSAPAFASTSIQCTLNSGDHTNTLHLSVDAISGKLSYQTNIAGQSDGGSLSRTCHPLLGHSKVSIATSGTITEELWISGESFSVCRVNAFNSIELGLEKTLTNGAKEWTIKKFAILHQLTTEEIESAEPQEVEELIGALCTMSP
jgi:hypothetical protein